MNDLEDVLDMNKVIESFENKDMNTRSQSMLFSWLRIDFSQGLSCQRSITFDLMTDVFEERFQWIIFLLLSFYLYIDKNDTRYSKHALVDANPILFSFYSLVVPLHTFVLRLLDNRVILRPNSRCRYD